MNRDHEEVREETRRQRKIAEEQREHTRQQREAIRKTREGVVEETWEKLERQQRPELRWPEEDSGG